MREGTAPFAQWRANLDRIETPASYASEVRALREHIGLVRRAVMAKADGCGTGA